jgi:Tfp pilus assembly protein PilF
VSIKNIYSLCKRMAGYSLYVVAITFIPASAFAAPLPQSHTDDAAYVGDGQLSPQTKSALTSIINTSSRDQLLELKKASRRKESAPVIIQRGTKPVPISTPIDIKKTKKSAKNKHSAKNFVVKSDLPNADISLYSTTIEDADTLLDMAYRALVAGQIEAATSYYKQVLESEPKNRYALFGLATIYHKNSQENQARDLYTRLLQQNPHDRQALNNFLVLVGEEAPESAIVELKRLEAVTPAFSPIPAQIGMVYAKMGDYPKAVRYLNKALLLSPENVTYRYNLAILLDRSGQYAEAISLYKELIEESNSGAILPTSTQYIRDRLTFLGTQKG